MHDLSIVLCASKISRICQPFINSTSTPLSSTHQRDIYPSVNHSLMRHLLICFAWSAMLGVRQSLIPCPTFMDAISTPLSNIYQRDINSSVKHSFMRSLLLCLVNNAGIYAISNPLPYIYRREIFPSVKHSSKRSLIPCLTFIDAIPTPLPGQQRWQLGNLESSS